MVQEDPIVIRPMVAGIVLSGCLAFLSQPACSDEGWLGLPNPFSSSRKSNSSPRLLGSKKPGLLEQMSQGTKKALTTTWDFVTLKWLWAQKTTNTASQTPKLYSRRKSSSSSKTNSITSWWNNLWTKKDSAGPKTLGEWLSQKRPEP